MQSHTRRKYPFHAPVGGIVPAAVAVLLWSLAPVLAELARAVPPLQLAAMVAGVATLATWPVGRLVGRRDGDPVAIPARIWLAGPLLVLGAIGFYFVALRLAPAAEAALVTYTWPVLFVIAAELVQVRRVHINSLAGTIVAFSGAALVLLEPSGPAGEPAWGGYAFAFASGTCWAAFSLLARQQPVPLSGIMPRLFGLATLWALGRTPAVRADAVVDCTGRDRLDRLHRLRALWARLRGVGYGFTPRTQRDGRNTGVRRAGAVRAAADRRGDGAGRLAPCRGRGVGRGGLCAGFAA
ncbi:MAG: DMT family transporter, partial [Halofilum sp. (in: g-proteobacteria)]|nr:DMT family transporter [Halofilum sp. (in: g-proteobacteria)]